VKNTSGKQKKADKRKTSRFNEVKKVKYKVLVAKEGEGFLQNLSEGGGCLMLDEDLSPGAILQLDILDLGESSKPVKVFCKVVWQEGNLTGVRYLKA